MRDADLTQAAVNDKFQAEGVLYICGTPIGNLDDASFRLIQVLKRLILACPGSTRRTRKLWPVMI